MDYTHQELGQEIEAISGYYTPEREIRLVYGSREVLCVVGRVHVEASCCGARHWRYAKIPGYILRWHYAKNKAGQPVSLVVPMTDEEEREAVRKMVATAVGESLQVEF